MTFLQDGILGKEAHTCVVQQHLHIQQIIAQS